MVYEKETEQKNKREKMIDRKVHAEPSGASVFIKRLQKRVNEKTIRTQRQRHIQRIGMCNICCRRK